MAAGKELAIDTTFAFERRRNRAVKYDRDVVANTLKALPVIQKIQSDRQRDFYKSRMVSRERETRKDALRELATGLDILGPLVVREKIKERAQQAEREMEVVNNDNGNNSTDDGNDIESET